MDERSSHNVVNNYKGVMLCSRPNQNQPVPLERPFCARVVPPDQIGLNPTKKEVPVREKPKKMRSPALEKHKKWLAQFQSKMASQKDSEELKRREEAAKLLRVKEQAENDRQRARKMKNQYNETATNVLNILDGKNSGTDPKNGNELTTQNLRLLDKQLSSSKAKEAETIEEQAFRKKKGQKPSWAMTKQEVERTEDKEVDELLNFFETNNIEEYSEDEQVKSILKHLKQKIEKMKEEDDWKEKQRTKLKKQDNEDEKNDNDDKYSHFSVQSAGKSVASEKTQKKIEELRQKQSQQQEWDNLTHSQKSSNIEDRIAKNLADEVLRNYPNMKGVHSNSSIRKLLEAEASKAMFEPISRPVITTVVREKAGLNASTLPYLHRNPAI